MDEKIAKELKNLTNKELNYIVNRGNKAILLSLRIAKRIGKTKILVQDQGGWPTYKDFAKRMKLNIAELKTDYGIINKEELKAKADKGSCLIINSLTGYFAEQDMNTIYNICKDVNCLLVNDASGSVGTELAKVGDIILASFGEDKPVNLGKGGFIAFNNKEFLDLIKIEEQNYPELEEKLKDLPKRIEKLKSTAKKIKQDLKEFEILHKEHDGINVIIKFKDEEEKNKILEYCKNNKYEAVITPKYHRVNCDAVSIEVKRL